MIEGIHKKSQPLEETGIVIVFLGATPNGL